MTEPVFVALLFADRVIEEINHKKTIVGTFTTFNAPRFPVLFPPWFIYAAVTNIEPKEHNFSIIVAHKDSQHVILSSGGDFKVENRANAPEFVLAVNNAPFPKEGPYVVTFNIDGKEIMSRILEVKLRPATGAHDV